MLLLEDAEDIDRLRSEMKLRFLTSPRSTLCFKGKKTYAAIYGEILWSRDSTASLEAFVEVD